MPSKEIGILLDAKKDWLVQILQTKKRHKTKEEQKKYDDRCKKANRYLEELEVLYSKVNLDDFDGRIVNQLYVDLVARRKVLITILDGEFVKVHKRTDTNSYLIQLASARDIKNFK